MCWTCNSKVSKVKGRNVAQAELLGQRNDRSVYRTQRKVSVMGYEFGHRTDNYLPQHEIALTTCPPLPKVERRQRFGHLLSLYNRR